MNSFRLNLIFLFLIFVSFGRAMADTIDDIKIGSEVVFVKSNIESEDAPVYGKVLSKAHGMRFFKDATVRVEKSDGHIMTVKGHDLNSLWSASGCDTSQNCVGGEAIVASDFYQDGLGPIAKVRIIGLSFSSPNGNTKFVGQLIEASVRFRDNLRTATIPIGGFISGLAVDMTKPPTGDIKLGETYSVRTEYLSVFGRAIGILSFRDSDGSLDGGVVLQQVQVGHQYNWNYFVLPKRAQITRVN